MDRVDAYLDELVSHLDCDPLRRDEIRLEVHSHLRELIDSGLQEGLPESDAVAAALERFGPAEQVARRLTAIHRGQRAQPARVDRPLIPILLAALVITPLGVMQNLSAPAVSKRFLDTVRELPADREPSSLVPGSVRAAVELYPGPLLGLTLLLALAVAVWHFTPRRPWLWAGVASVAGSVFYLLLVATPIWIGSRDFPSYWLTDVADNWLRSTVRGLAWPIVAVWALPWLARWLGRRKPRLPWPWLALGLLALATWAHPLVCGLADFVWRVDRDSWALTDLGLASWPWQLTRLAALPGAMWLAGQWALGEGPGHSPGRVAGKAALVGLAVGLLVTFARLAPLALQPRWQLPPLDTALMCGEFVVLLASGSAVLLLARLSRAGEPQLAPVGDPSAVPAG
jgi:hypothetical protein